ncbi:MAG: 4-hydroxy-3-methylbut-2-enyl diphosphate reductase, partial [Hungatella sp.]
MEVIVAKTAGFCFGVKRAVDKVYEQIEHAG